MSHQGLRCVEASIYNDLNHAFHHPHSHTHGEPDLSSIDENEQQPDHHRLKDQAYHTDTASESGDDLREIITIYAGFDVDNAQAEPGENTGRVATTPDTSGYSNTSTEYLQPRTYTPSISIYSGSSGSSDGRPQINLLSKPRSKKETQAAERQNETLDRQDHAKVISKSASFTIFEVAQYSNEREVQDHPHLPPSTGMRPAHVEHLVADDADDEQSLADGDDLSSLEDSGTVVRRPNKFIIDSSHNLPRRVAQFSSNASANVQHQHQNPAFVNTEAAQTLRSTSSQDTIRTFDVTPSIVESEVDNGHEMGIAEAIEMHRVLAAEARSSTETEGYTPPQLRHRTLRHAQTFSVLSNGSPMLRSEESIGNIGEGVKTSRYLTRDDESGVFGTEDVPIIVSKYPDRRSGVMSNGGSMATTSTDTIDEPRSRKLLGVEKQNKNTTIRVSVQSQLLRHKRCGTGLHISVEKDANDVIMGAPLAMSEGTTSTNTKASSVNGSNKTASSQAESEASSKSKSSDGSSKKTRFDQQTRVEVNRPKHTGSFDHFRFMMGPEAPAERPSSIRGGRTSNSRPSYESIGTQEKRYKTSSRRESTITQKSSSQVSENTNGSSSNRGRELVKRSKEATKENSRPSRDQSPGAESTTSTIRPGPKPAKVKTRFSSFLHTFTGTKHDQVKNPAKQQSLSQFQRNDPDGSHAPRVKQTQYGDSSSLMVPRKSYDASSICDEARSIYNDAQSILENCAASTNSDLEGTTGEAIDRAIGESKNNFDIIIRRCEEMEDPAMKEAVSAILLPLSTAIQATAMARQANMKLELAVGQLAYMTGQLGVNANQMLQENDDAVPTQKSIKDT